MRTLFLVNPKAHKVERRGSALMSVADERGLPLTLLDEGWAPDESADRVYIEGGDGTVRWVVSRYLEAGLSLPEFAIVRGGTTDQIAGVIGLRRQTTKGLLASLDAPLEPFAVPVLQVRHATGVDYGFVFSTNAIPRVTDAIERYRGPTGLSGGLLVARAIVDATRPGTKLLETRPARVTIDARDEHVVFEEDHLGTLATTLPGLYLGLDPFWGEGPGAIRLTYAGAEASALVPTLLGQWAGRKNADTLARRGYQSFNTEFASVETGAGAVLDGDVIHGERFELTASVPLTFVR